MFSSVAFVNRNPNKKRIKRLTFKEEGKVFILIKDLKTKQLYKKLSN